MVNPLGSPESHSPCPPLPPGVWGERWLPPHAQTHPFGTGRRCLSLEPAAVPWAGGTLLPWHPLAKEWLSLTLVPPAPTQVASHRGQMPAVY